MAGDRLPGGDRGAGGQTQVRLCTGARGVPHRAAPAVRERLRPRCGSLARGLCDCRRRGARSASSLSDDGVAGRGTAGQEQDGRTPFAPRCRKDVVEERLFAHRRDLFTRLDLVFMDTTSLYFEGAGGATLGRHGFSKDHRPDLKQMILAVLIDGDGRPVCSEMWPGNTADVTTLIPVIDRLSRRSAITRVCVVADRGMISAETMAELAARGLFYILGVRERTDKLVPNPGSYDPSPSA